MKEEKEKSETDSKEKLEDGQPIKVDWEPTEIDRFVYLYRVIFSQWYSVAEICRFLTAVSISRMC